MDKNYFIQLTLGLYKVTEMLPEREPLRYKIRDKASDILSELAQTGFDISNINQEKIIKDLSILNIYFDIAAEQDWIDSRNFLVLRQGYVNLKEMIFQQYFLKKPIKKEPTGDTVRKTEPRKTVVKEQAPKNEDISPRKKEICDILSKKGPMRLVSMLQYFPNISKRTLRRDIGALVEQRAVKRYDEGKLTYYKV